MAIGIDSAPDRCEKPVTGVKSQSNTQSSRTENSILGLVAMKVFKG